MIAPKVPLDVPTALPAAGPAATGTAPGRVIDMERGWLETIQLLGLDVVLAVTLALAALDWVAHRLARRAAHERPARTPSAAMTAHHPVEPPAGLAWPPGPWRTSH
jgi:hypothetical protein